MAYITESDIARRLGQDKLIELTDNEGSGEVDHDRVGEAIAYAEGTLNSFLRLRYAIPVTTTQEIKARCLDLAIFDLYKDRATLDEGIYKVRKDQHDAAISWAKSVGKGEAALDVATAEETKLSPASPDKVLSGSSESHPARFTKDNLKGW
jgi:phage gp36-like protein